MKFFLAFAFCLLAAASAMDMESMTEEQIQEHKRKAEDLIVRLLPDCDERICLDHQAQMDICMGQGEPAMKFHKILAECALERVSIFGELAKEQMSGMKDMESDPNAPCELKDYLMHALGMKKCMLVKMGWMCEESCQLIPDQIADCFSQSPVADSFYCEESGMMMEACDVVGKCMDFGGLMTCENMEEFVCKLEEMDMDYFKDLAMAGMNTDGMPEGDNEVATRMADDMKMTPETFLNFSQNLVRLNCLQYTYNKACQALVQSTVYEKLGLEMPCMDDEEEEGEDEGEVEEEGDEEEEEEEDRDCDEEESEEEDRDCDEEESPEEAEEDRSCEEDTYEDDN